MTRFAPKYVRTLFVCLMLLFVAGVHAAEATHFLGGKITWRRDFTHPNPNEAKVEITFEASWRATFGWTPFPSIPNTLITNPLYQLTLTTAQGATNTLDIQQRVVTYNATDDWFTGRYVFVVVYPLSAFPVQVLHQNCCRSSVLKETNNDTSWQLRTVIDVSKGTRSPDSTLLPRISLTQNAPNTFQLPTIAYDGLTNRVTVAPTSESLLVIARPVGNATCTGGCAQCFNSLLGACSQSLQVTNAGLVTWTPQIAGLYAIQFTITSVDANGVIKNSTPLDALIEVETPCNPADPTCNTPPVIVPLPPSVTATAGQQMSLNVSASDLQATQIVTVASSVLPAGATFTLLTNPPTNHVSYLLHWTPTNAQVGDHTVCFQAYDNAGGTSQGQACTTIHALPSPPPQVVCNAVPALEADHLGINVALSGASFDPEGTAVGIAWKIGPVTFATATIPAGTLSLAPVNTTRNLLQGTTTVTLQGTDTVGSIGSCNIVVTVNKLSQSITFTGDDAVPFVFASLVPLNGAATSGLPVAYQVLSGPGAIVGNQLKILGVGAIEVKALQFGDADYAPATEVPAFFHVVDVTAPAIAPHAPATAEATGPGGAVVSYGSVSFTDDVDGNGTAACAPASDSMFPVGATTVNCHAQDTAGNGSDSSFVVTVTDHTAPTIGTVANITVPATGPSGAAVTIVPPDATDIVDGTITPVCPAAGTTFPRGTTTAACTATDAHGNAASTSFTVTVINNAPNFTPPPDISTPATSPAGAVVTFTPTGSDVEDGTLTAVCTPISGSTFGITTTTVTCHVEDSDHVTVTASFTVTVTNNAPSVSVPSNITAEATSGAGATVSFTATASDIEQGPITPTCTPAAGVFPIGTTTVTCTATDVANASGSASFTVTVQDTTAPVVTYSGNAGSYALNQTVNITCSASDAVGVASSTCADISGPAYSFAATNTFSATATDAAGHTGTGSTTFTVVNSLQNLQALVNAFCDNPGVCSGLNAKLQAAASASNANARAGQLGAFENQVRAQTGKCLTPAEAAILLQLVQAFY